MKTLYKNTARDEQLDRELEELEAKYREENDPEHKAKVEEEGTVDTGIKSDEDVGYKKRYADLRSYSSKKENELRKQIEALEKKVEAASQNPDMPKNKEEAKEWVEKYPDLARVLSTLMEEKVEKARSDVDSIKNELDLERLELARERALDKVIHAHPDFLTLIEDKKFQDWVNDQPVKRGSVVGKALYDALYNNDTDAQAAIEAVNVYKSDIGKKPKEKADTLDAARTVPKTAPTVPNRADGKKVWLESDIEKMDIRSYDRYEKEIEEARLEGRIEYDLSGAAR